MCSLCFGHYLSCQSSSSEIVGDEHLQTPLSYRQVKNQQKKSTNQDTLKLLRQVYIIINVCQYFHAFNLALRPDLSQCSLTLTLTLCVRYERQPFDKVIPCSGSIEQDFSRSCAPLFLKRQHSSQNFLRRGNFIQGNYLLFNLICQQKAIIFNDI